MALAGVAWLVGVCGAVRELKGCRFKPGRGVQDATDHVSLTSMFLPSPPSLKAMKKTKSLSENKKMYIKIIIAILSPF